MRGPSSEALRFLTELHQAVKADPNASVSMYDIGRTLGLDKTQAGRVGEEVIAMGWAEIKTLSGAIGITTEGLLVAEPSGGASAAPRLTLGREVVLDAESRVSAEKALALIQERIPGLATSYAGIEELVIDLKTAQVQLLSPRPKTAILREILRSLQIALRSAGAGDTAAVIESMLA